MRPVLVGAGLVRVAWDEGPVGACDGKRDFVDGDDVTGRQFPEGSAMLRSRLVATGSCSLREDPCLDADPSGWE